MSELEMIFRLTRELNEARRIGDPVLIADAITEFEGYALWAASPAIRRRASAILDQHRPGWLCA